MKKSKTQPICLICSHGGHLTEMLFLMDAFKGNDVFFVTYESTRTKKLKYKKHLIKNIGANPFRMLQASFAFLKIFIIEKPSIIISTGSEIAIPAFYIAKLFRIKTIFIESWCRIESTSGTGRLVYPVSDLFFVQWPQLLKVYGPKAKYVGSVIL